MMLILVDYEYYLHKTKQKVNHLNNKKLTVYYRTIISNLKKLYTGTRNVIHRSEKHFVNNQQLLKQFVKNFTTQLNLTFTYLHLLYSIR